MKVEEEKGRGGGGGGRGKRIENKYRDAKVREERKRRPTAILKIIRN